MENKPLKEKMKKHKVIFGFTLVMVLVFSNLMFGALLNNFFEYDSFVIGWSVEPPSPWPATEENPLSAPTEISIGLNENEEVKEKVNFLNMYHETKYNVVIDISKCIGTGNLSDLNEEQLPEVKSQKKNLEPDESNLFYIELEPSEKMKKGIYICTMVAYQDINEEELKDETFISSIINWFKCLFSSCEEEDLERIEPEKKAWEVDEPLEEEDFYLEVRE